MVRRLFSTAVLCAVALFPACADKTVYVIGGWLPATRDGISAKLRPLYEDYLNDYFRRVFSGSATFKFVSVDYSAESFSDDMIRDNKIDFLYSIPGRTVCVEAEFGWIPVVTQRGYSRGKETGAQGSILFSLKSNTKIRNVTDLQGSMIGVGYLLASNSYHFGYQLLLEHGIDLFTDISKLVFYSYEYQAMLDDVVKEKLDAAILPSAWLVENNNDVLETQLLVHTPREYTYEGEAYPFPTSTPLAPQYGLIASPDVPWHVKAQVTEALTNLTRDHPAAAAAAIATFTMPGHFANVRQALDEMGLMNQPTLKDWASGKTVSHCHTPFEDVIETIDCPAGYVMQDEETIAHKCVKDGKVCPAGRPCLCYPCQKDLQVRVFPAKVVMSLVVTLFSFTLLLSFFWVLPLEAAPYAKELAFRLRRAARPVLTRLSRKHHRPHTASY